MAKKIELPDVQIGLLYSNGIGSERLAAIYGVSHSTVQKRLSLLQAKQTPRAECLLSNFIEMYYGGKDSGEIARAIGIGTSTMANWRRVYNLPLRDPRQKSKAITKRGCKTCAGKDGCGRTLPLDQFYERNGIYNQPCKECFCKRIKTRYCKEGARRRKLLDNYGLTEEMYDAMLAKQGGVCAICKKDNGPMKKDKLFVDHCHDTGKVRALLCGHCNCGIGYFKDSPAILTQAIDYLKKHQTVAA